MFDPFTQLSPSNSHPLPLYGVADLPFLWVLDSCPVRVLNGLNGTFRTDFNEKRMTPLSTLTPSLASTRSARDNVFASLIYDSKKCGFFSFFVYCSRRLPHSSFNGATFNLFDPAGEPLGSPQPPISRCC